MWSARLLVVAATAALGALLHVAALDAAGAAATEGRLEREVNVALRVEAHHEARHVHQLLAHTKSAQKKEKNKKKGKRERERERERERRKETKKEEEEENEN